MDKWQPEPTWEPAKRPVFCLMGRAPSAKAAASSGCICQLFRADAEVCVYTRKTEKNVVLCRHWQHIPVVLHAIFLPWSPYSLSFFSSCCSSCSNPWAVSSEESIREPGSLEYEDIWQEKDIHLDLSCNRMSGLILLVSLCPLSGIFEELREKRLTLASF